ncbi:MAG: ABC transporter substrate-binding protein [Deltaproteobacteria bacterium]|nr:ABC transporter substrate-binding protein [Deltaproteobacteria bacterium]
MECAICEHRCYIAENGTGICGMYTNKDNRIAEKYPDNYLVVVPSEIESMPMLHYYPGNKFLQVCTIGCNFRCSGCVSWILTENLGSIEGALHGMNPEEIVGKALSEGCAGIMFCFNEPAVSFLTFKRIASLARARGLLVGCATNAYFTESSFRDLLRHIDFVSIGIKGCTDKTYALFGAASASPIFRNLELSIESGVSTEVAAVYVKGYENEVLETAKVVASISRDIPFQVMRFIPLAAADIADEPSVREAETLCEHVRGLLNYVYLFNSPGTHYLNTYCPECGKVVVRRGFNGPMCAHVFGHGDAGACECGFRPPFAGTFEKESGAQVLGFLGGYKTIHILESIQTVLAFLGERNPSVVASVLQQILGTDFIERLYERSKEIDSYLNTVDHYAKLAGRTDEAHKLREYIEKYVSIIKNRTKDAQRPSVYFSLGHPLIAIFGDKFECNLVEIAGGRCLNKDLERDDAPGMTIPEETFKRLNPEVILISGAMGYPVADFRNFCVNNGLNDIKAVKDGKVFSMHPYSTAGRPDWILGLMQMANILHPEIFSFDMKNIADAFYERFLGVRLPAVGCSRSITHPAVLEQVADGHWSDYREGEQK